MSAVNRTLSFPVARVTRAICSSNPNTYSWKGKVPFGTASFVVTLLSPRGETMTALSPEKSTEFFVSIGPGSPPMLCVTTSRRRIVPSGFKSAV